jgi:gamma-glutamyltranspeptidase/glutathione hydrolase
MVATSHPAVTAAAVGVLQAGGNAIDAMLTAMPLQQVLEPQLSTVAGGFGLLYWDAASSKSHYLNANPDHPRGGPDPGVGSADTSGERVAVPGTVVGMGAAAEAFGTYRWEQYFGPAVAAAEDGFPMYPQLHSALVGARERISRYRSGRERYLPDGHLPPPGTLFRQPSLAATLRRISEPDGVEWFQRGGFADRFVTAVRATGGRLTTEDLADYEVRWGDPLRFHYGGHEVLGTPLPDTGGLYCAFALGLLEWSGLRDLGPWLTSARALALIARAQALAEAHIARYGADPVAFHVPDDVLLSAEYLELTARLVTGSWPRTAPPTSHGGIAAPLRSEPRERPDRPTSVGSNQLVIVDEAGNWVTMLHTGFGTDFGTGLVVEGVGTNGANVFPGVHHDPGRRVVAPLSSALVLRNGRPWLGLGTPGYPPPSTTLVLLNLLEYGMGLHEAVDAPRFAFDQDPSGPLAVETRLPRATLDGLELLGVTTRPLGDYNPATGRFQAITRDGQDRLVGVVDPRGSGRASGWS